jgi:ketosteroid isomerase-like protein
VPSVVFAGDVASEPVEEGGQVGHVLVAQSLPQLTVEGEGHPAELEKEILALGRRWAGAERDGDPATLATLLADDFVCVGPLGFVLDKEQYLQPRRAGILRHRSLTWEDVHIRRYGDTAVAVGVQTQENSYSDQDASGRFRVTQIAVRQATGWVMAGLHYSPIAPPPGGRP